jgi:GNAT superfamily N-acetyltransferase
VLPDGVHGPAEPTYDPSAAPYYEEPMPAPDGASWYHVTEERFKPGDTLVPSGARSVFDEDGFYDSPDNKGRKRWVWMEPDLARMETWVSEINGRAPVSRDWKSRGLDKPKTRVYKVSPHTTPQPWESYGSGGWVAGGADVLGEVTDDEFNQALLDDYERRRREEQERSRARLADPEVRARQEQAWVDNAIAMERGRRRRIEIGEATDEDLIGPAAVDSFWGKYLPDSYRQQSAPAPKPKRRAAIRFEVNPALGLDDDLLVGAGGPGNWAYAIDDEPSEDASGRPLGAGEPVAELCWDPHSGEVNWVQTRKNRRRQGIGRGLFNWVRENHQPDLRHSDDLSDDGRAFAEAVAAVRTARALLGTTRGGPR